MPGSTLDRPGIPLTPSRGRLGGHAPFLLVLLVAALFRVVAALGYRPAIWFTDSITYLDEAVTGTPGLPRPSGYSLYLWLLKPFHSLTLVMATQHVMGLLVAVLVYAVACRCGVPRWGATLAAAPVLFDAYEIELERLVLSDTLFLLFGMAALALVLWRSPPPLWAVVAGGLCAGLSVVTRPTGIAIAVGVVLAVLLRVPLLKSLMGPLAWWKRAGATGLALAACATPVFAYGLWFSSVYGEFGLSRSTGVFLYGRVMAFAECPKMRPPPELRRLCTKIPPERRMISQNYIWRGSSPLNRIHGARYSVRKNRLAQRFALRAISAQPLDYLRAVGHDTLRAFAWDRTVFPDRLTYDRYLFGTRPAELAANPNSKYVRNLYRRAARYELGPVRTRVYQPWAGLAHAYQGVVFLRGTMVGAVLLAGLVVALVRRGPPGRLAAGPWVAAAGLIVLPAATAEFDYRYVLTAVPFGCLALALSCASRNNPGQISSPSVASGTVRGEAEGGRGGTVAGRGVRGGP
ncbi:phospholipid carrier-dependent glycosyltransferase [Actinomadura harenae]|uniref:phospholipid carrier-dependent glycosyltransferase n=1 Tax=Actinomadura harenae TaxID=2483351 RepID=UPI0011C3F898|nr:phospholipid carrier-dependent glycosyltransferase [Actinomadura harenae]